MNDPGVLINPAGSGSAPAFTAALLQSLNDLYTKTQGTNVYRLYSALGNQLADLDIQTQRVLHDLFLSLTASNEQVTRGYTLQDQLLKQGAYALQYIGFVPSGTIYTQTASLSLADTEIILDRIPTSQASITLTLNGTDYSTLITNYNSSNNTVTITPVSTSGLYTVRFTDAGCTLYSSEQAKVTSQGTTYIATLQNAPVLYDSERVVIHNSAVGVLQRGIDYNINYTTGVITSLPKGFIAQLKPDLLDVQYRYQFLFDTLTDPAFFNQVFNEQAVIVGSNVVEISRDNISEVFRLFNTNTRETYGIESISRNQITFTSQAPLTTGVSPAQLVATTFVSLSNNKVTYSNTFTVDIANNIYQVQTLNKIYAQSQYARLVRGGREVVPGMITFPVPLELNTITLITGATSVYRCKTTLSLTTDYSLSVTGNQAVLILSTSGKAKVGNNSLYAQLNLSLSPFNNATTDVNQVQTFATNTVVTCNTEQVTFAKQTMLLVNGLYYVLPTQNGDQPIGENILVTNSNKQVLVAGTDYSYDPIQKALTILVSSSININDTVTVTYLGQYNTYLNYTYSPDIIVCDYSYTSNAIDWSPSIQQYNITFNVTLDPSTNTIQLIYQPSDVNNLELITVTALGDASTTLTTISYDPNQRLLYVTPPAQTQTFVVSYLGFKHKIDPGVPYFVTYLYGARNGALENSFAPLLQLTNTTRRRTEVQQLIGNQTQVTVQFPPIDIQNIAIYPTGSPSNDLAATVLGLNTTTNTLTITPIRAYGSYTIAYDTAGALTEDLRTMIIGLMKAFLTGPTLVGMQELIETFTDITPYIEPLSSLGFRIADQSVNNPALRSEALNDVMFVGTGVEFVPSKFNVGLYSTSQNQTTVSAPAITTVEASQGTIQFLLGPQFDSNVPVSHYFIDIGTKGSYYNNRISIYKNERGYLVFELFDNRGNIRRVVSPVSHNQNVFTQFLTAGSNSVSLPTRPSFSSTDISNNGELDLFKAQPTELLINRIYTTTADAQTFFPLEIAILFQIKNDLEYGTLDGFNRATQRLFAVMKATASASGIAVVHVSVTYLNACSQYSNVLKTFQNNGYEIGLYLDVPITIIDPAAQSAYIQQGLTVAKQLGLNIQSFSCNFALRNWIEIANGLGLQIAAGYVDPLSGVGFTNPSPAIRRAQGTVIPTTLDTTGGTITYLPGATDLNYARPLSPVTMQQLLSTLLRSLSQNQPAQVSSWYATFEVEDFTDNYLAESKMIGTWLQQTITPLVIQQKVQWKRFIDSFAIFRTLEALELQESAKIANVLNRTDSVQPLLYNWDTNVLTFEPVPFDGIYQFNYVTGWQKYEESEIFVCAVYKLHTDDGALPYYKLYINGELQDFTTFADFPVI